MSGTAGTPSGGPTGRRRCAASARSTAPVEEVWPLIGEADRWKEWSFLDRTGRVRDGEPVPDGVGAVRRFTSHGIGSEEEVVVWEPPRHLGYIILKGFPVRHYRADVVITPEGTGSMISWSATFDTTIVGTGHLMTAVLQSIISRFTRNVAAYASDRAGSAG